MASPIIPPAAADDFLSASGWAGARIEPLAGDASFRRYFRVFLDDGRQGVLMDAPPPHEDPRPFVAVAEWLSGIGLTAPQILARDLERGLLLLDDFGSDRLRERLDLEGHREAELYEVATDLLVHLHTQPPMAGLAVHGLDQWLDEVALFADWYLPAVGLEGDADGYRAAWRKVLKPVSRDGLGPVTVLRDYHAENVMLVAGREGVEHFGLLDFQDALAGHPAYDLVSVLEDARRDVSPEIERAMIDRYLAAAGQSEAFERAYWALAAQRNTRILGVFVRLWKRDGKPGYRKFQPRMWGLLERDLQHPSMVPMREWFDSNVPPSKRAAFWEGPDTRRTRAMALRPEIDAAAPRTAMVMGAELGKRMRPLTATRPKPLIEVAGKPLIDHVLDRLRAAGVERVVVNVHYLADAIEAHLAGHAAGLSVTVSDERRLLLETGGGLVQAAPMIDDDPFLVVNSDNYWIDGPADTLRLLASHWRDGEMDALLLVVPHARASNNSGVGDFHMDALGRLRRRGKGRVAPFVFTGIQIVSKRLLRDAPDGPFSTNILWDRAMEEGRCFGAVHQGLWFDVGSPPAIKATEAALSG